MHTEAACASGALSVLLGATWIMGGFHDAVLVVGAEQQKTMSSRDGGDVLGSGGGFRRRAAGVWRLHVPEIVRTHRADLHRQIWRQPGRLSPPSPTRITRTRALNPLAQMRESTLTFGDTQQVSEKNPSVAPPLRLTDCSQITDGAAGARSCFGQISRPHRPR